MPLDISKLERMHDFSFITEVFGEVRCGSVSAGALIDLEKTLNETETTGRVFSRKLLGMVGKRATPVGDLKSGEAQWELLSEGEVSSVTDSELEVFSKGFVAHNEWLLQSYANSREMHANESGEATGSDTTKIVNFPKEDGESNVDYLLRVFRFYIEEQGRRLNAILSPSASLLAASQFAERWADAIKPLSSWNKGIFKDSTLDSLRLNLGLSDQLRDTIQMFNKSALDSDSFVAKPGLEITRAPVFKLPENPIVETNRRLNRVLEHIEGIRPVVSQSAELIGNMNDTALRMQADFMRNARSGQRYASVAIVIAVLSLVTSSFFSWLSYIDGKESAKKNDEQMRVFQEEIRSLVAAQEKERVVLVNALNGTKQHQFKPKK